MNQKIKIKFNNFEYTKLKDFFPTKVLLENFDIEDVQDVDNADVIVDLAYRWGSKDYLRKDKKRIIISNENLYFKRNLFSLVESLMSKSGMIKKKYKILDILDVYIPKIISSFPFDYFMKKYLRLITKVSKDKEKDTYAIICNDIKGEYIFNLPYFIQEYYYTINSLKKNKTVPKKTKFCAFIVSSNSSRERVDFFKKLSKYKKVDSYGKVMNNMGEDILEKNWIENYKLLRDYKFVICFENSFANEYITEKIINAMRANAVPIYRGASNIGKYFNTKSFINYNDYGTYDKMIEKIIQLDKDSLKYKMFMKQPWFLENKVPQIIKNKEKELIEFYRRILE